MANEYILTVAMKNQSQTGTPGLTFSGVQRDSSDAALFNLRTLDVSTGEIAIPLGNVVVPGFFLVYHNGTTNTVIIRDASGGNTLANLNPGDLYLNNLKTVSTAPYTIAAAGTEEIQYYMAEAS